jgi:hypothetical protein
VVNPIGSVLQNKQLDFGEDEIRVGDYVGIERRCLHVVVFLEARQPEYYMEKV